MSQPDFSYETSPYVMPLQNFEAVRGKIKTVEDIVKYLDQASELIESTRKEF